MALKYAQYGILKNLKRNLKDRTKLNTSRSLACQSIHHGFDRFTPYSGMCIQIE